MIFFATTLVGRNLKIGRSFGEAGVLGLVPTQILPLSFSRISTAAVSHYLGYRLVGCRSSVSHLISALQLPVIGQ